MEVDANPLHIGQLFLEDVSICRNQNPMTNAKLSQVVLLGHNGISFGFELKDAFVTR